MRPTLLCLPAQLFMQSFRVVSRYEKRACWRYYIKSHSLCFIRFSYFVVGRVGNSPTAELRVFARAGTHSACSVLIPLVRFYRAFLPVRTPIRHGVGALGYY